jgi:hypothetical protein
MLADPNRLYRSQSGSEEQKCEASEGPVCHQLHNCQACSTHSNCHWDFEQRCKAVGNVTEQQVFLLTTFHFIFYDKLTCNLYFPCARMIVLDWDENLDKFWEWREEWTFFILHMKIFKAKGTPRKLATAVTAVEIYLSFFQTCGPIRSTNKEELSIIMK